MKSEFYCKSYKDKIKNKLAKFRYEKDSSLRIFGAEIGLSTGQIRNNELSTVHTIINNSDHTPKSGSRMSLNQASAEANQNITHGNFMSPRRCSNKIK